MKPVREDGSLDVEHINNLPIREYTVVINSLTSRELEYYNSHIPINEGKQHTKGIKFCPYNEVIAKGLGVDADAFLVSMRKKYLKK